MKKTLLKILLTFIIAFKSLFLMAMETQPNFDEDMDKLIFVAKAQTHYLGNWIALIKENTPEAQSFLENFIFPVGGQELRRVRAIQDFYMDYLFSKYLEISLLKLKAYNAQRLKGEIDSINFQKTLAQFYENIRRAHDITIGDVVKRGSSYICTISLSHKLVYRNNIKNFSCDADDIMGVLGANLISELDAPELINVKEYTDRVNYVFKNDPVTIHFFNQALNLENISDTLQKHLNKVITKTYNTPDIGMLNLTYDNIFKAVLIENTFNNSLISKIGFEEAIQNGAVLSQKNKKYLSMLRKIYKSTDSVEFLSNEDDFIEQQAKALFVTKKAQTLAGDGGWGSNPVIDRFNKNKISKLQKTRKKPQGKSTNNRPQVAKLEIKVDVALESSDIILGTAIKQEVQAQNNEILDFDNMRVFFLNEAPHYATGAYPIIIKYLDFKTLCSLICTSKNLNQFFLDASKQIRISEIVYEEELFDFDEWYENNVTARSCLKNALVKSESSPLFSKPQFYGLGEVFLNVVFGYGYVEVTTKHFNSFLKQAGGYKVKMSQNGYIPICLKDKSVETHYVVPNLEGQTDTPFCLYLVHQPHSASLPFPKKTLYSFLRRDLTKAGYAR